MNVNEYKDKKSRGLAEVVKAGGGYAFAVKRYDPANGSEMVPDIESISIDDLAVRKAELVKEINDITELMKDIEKFK